MGRREGGKRRRSYETIEENKGRYLKEWIVKVETLGMTIREWEPYGSEMYKRKEESM